MRSAAAVAVVSPPASSAELRVLVLNALNAQLELSRALRELEQAAGNGQWRGDLVIALEKAEASGFWFREGTRCLQAAKACKLLPDTP